MKNELGCAPNVMILAVCFFLSLLLAVVAVKFNVQKRSAPVVKSDVFPFCFDGSLRDPFAECRMKRQP